MSQHEEFADWLTKLPDDIENNYRILKHGDLPLWKNAVESLHDLANKHDDYALTDTIRIGEAANLSKSEKKILESALIKLCPWRKGPFNLFGIHIETEWRSDWKWLRLQEKIFPLQNRKVLDVGCGSCYHLWRMREAGAELVLGIDPSLLFWQQFSAIKQICISEIMDRQCLRPSYQRGIFRFT